MRKTIVIFGLGLSLSGCATIIKGKSEMVTFHNAPENGATVRTPTSTHKLHGTTGTFMLLRSKPDVPIEVICNEKRHRGVLSTQANIAFILGNLVFGGIPGWIIDGFGNSGYDYIQPVDLGILCDDLVVHNNR